MRPFHKKTKTIGLCLSGGGARGLAHIGVLKALLEHGIRPTHISGASMGAIIGTLYASGYPVESMVESAHQLGWKQILPDRTEVFKPNKKGLLSIKYLQNILAGLPCQQLEELSVPAWVSITNMTTGTNILYNKGPVSVLVTASCAIPGLFDPVKYEGDIYVDGGISNNFPIESLLECDLIIGSDVNCYGTVTTKMNTQELITKSTTVLFNQAVEHKKKQCHILVQPSKLAEYGILDFDKSSTIIEIGYAAAIEQLKHVNNLV